MNIQSVQKYFEPFGFADIHIRVYVALLRNGELSMTEIANITKLSRSRCYDICAFLQKRGAIGSYKTTQGSRYQAVAPKVLLKILQKHVDEAEQTIEYFEKKRNNHSLRPQVQQYIGLEGFAQAVLPSIEKPGSIIYHFGSYNVTNTVFPLEYDVEFYLKKRIEKKLP